VPSLPRRNVPKAQAVVEKERRRVRRRYKVNLKTRKRYAPGEEDFIADMVIVLSLGGFSRTQMAKTLGISKGQVKEALELPQITDRLLELRKRLPQAALDLLHSYLVEAVQAVVDVMRTSTRDEIILKAAGEILDRGGVSKASRSEQDIHKVEETKTTFSSDAMVDAIRQLPPEKQEEAAQMIEDLEKHLTEQFKNSEGTQK
jgi:hypothetical protein